MNKFGYSGLTPKSTYYRDNGTGRDSYIRFNNGGMYVPTVARSEYPCSQFRGKRSATPNVTNSSNKIVRYKNNGGGRDAYIYSTHGGFETDGGDRAAGSTFYRGLRTWASSSQVAPNDIFSQVQSQKSDYSYYIKQRRLSMSQKEQASRLSRPKTRG